MLAAALRNAGIPARRIVGFWTSDSWRGGWAGHERTEFYLPGAGWLVADACQGNGCDPTSNYTPDFCFVPDANGFFVMDIANEHTDRGSSFGQLQGPGCPPSCSCPSQEYL